MKVLGQIVKDYDKGDTILTQLAEMATNSGLKLLTPFSIIDVEMFGLMRCINALSVLCRNASPQQIRLVQLVGILRLPIKPVKI